MLVVHCHASAAPPPGDMETDPKIKPGTGERDHRLGMGCVAEPGAGEGNHREVTRWGWWVRR
jgi:hypothetical protein